MRKLRDRIEEDGITAEAVMSDAPAYADDWTPGTNWYRVTLAYGRRRMTVPFGMGPAHTSEPGANDVLSALASDASSYENSRGSFEEWAGEYGYDTDSRRAEKIYRQVREQTEELRRFLGDQFDAYVWDTEGL